jgi:hypothetical protein
LKALNIFSIVIICGITAFFSVFTLGSYEQHKQLINQLPFSFIGRVAAVSAIGLIGLGFLIVINFLFDKFFFKKVNISVLKKIAYTGFLWVFLIAFLGCFLFFFGEKVI